MRLEWDDSKNARNRDKHGLDFAEAYNFPWEDAVLANRSRHSDGENRFAAIGWLYGKLSTLIFTRRGNAVRIISLRRANRQEEKYHEENESAES
jgi:uncharacterized DUF497 family protein